MNIASVSWTPRTAWLQRAALVHQPCHLGLTFGCKPVLQASMSQLRHSRFLQVCRQSGLTQSHPFSSGHLEAGQLSLRMSRQGNARIDSLQLRLAYAPSALLMHTLIMLVILSADNQPEANMISRYVGPTFALRPILGWTQENLSQESGTRFSRPPTHQGISSLKCAGHC